MANTRTLFAHQGNWELYIYGEKSGFGMPPCPPLQIGIKQMSIGQFPLQQVLAAQIHSAVVHNPHLNHRQMHIKTKQGRVVINGTVDSFFEKQMAQEALRRIEGVKSIENNLEATWN